MDTDFKISKVNDAAVHIIGREEEALVGYNARDVFADPNDWIVGSLDFVSQTGGEDYHADTDFRGGGNQSKSVNLTVAPLIDIDGEPMGFMLVFEDITGEKRLRTTMARYLAKEIVDKVMESGNDAFLGTSQEVTVLFSDIRRFTAMAERLGASDTVSMLNEYFTAMVDVVLRRHGLLDKYIGDAIMAVFGAPLIGSHDADNAVNVAIEMMQALRHFNVTRVRDGQEPLEISIGINTGEVIAGSVGSEKRMDYTVIGDSVNLAARLESANKFYGTSVLLGESTVAQLSSAEGLREIDLLRVKGKNKPIAVFEPLASYPPEICTRFLEALPVFEEARGLYRARRWQEAGRHYTSLLERCPEDGVAKHYVDRCNYYAENEPEDDWDGVWTLTQK